MRHEHLAGPREHLRTPLATEQRLADEPSEPRHLQADGRRGARDRAGRLRHRAGIDRHDEGAQQLERQVRHESSSSQDAERELRSS